MGPVSEAITQTGDRRLAGASRGGHLVITVGGSPVPVLLTLLGLQPERVTAITSPRSDVVWQRVWSAFVDLAPAYGALTPRVVEVPARDLAAATRAVGEEADAAEEPVHLGYSGGSAAMSAGAFLGWWREVGVPSSAVQEGGPAAWYVAEHGDALVRHDGGYVEAADILGTRNLGLVAMLHLHGLESAGLDKRPDAWTPRQPAAEAPAVRDAIRRLPIGGMAKDLDVLRRQAEAQVVDALALIGLRGGVDVYPRLRATSPAVGEEPGSSVDLGLACVRGLRLRMIEVASYRRAKPGAPEVTRRWPPGPLKEALFDAASRARLAGGLHAGAGLVSLEPRRANAHPVVEMLWRDTGPLTAPARLGYPGQEGEPALPAMTAFAEAELLESLREIDDEVPLIEGNDLTRWLCGVTE